jgi:hypothetical protein
MRLILVASSFFLLSAVANATDSKAICPSTITCDYDKGTCDQPDEWLISNGSNQKPFIGSQYFELFDMRAIRIDFPKELSGKYRINCFYALDPKRPSGLIGITTLANKLVGENWVISNSFDKSVAVCSDVADPSTCAGMRTNNIQKVVI